MAVSSASFVDGVPEAVRRINDEWSLSWTPGDDKTPRFKLLAPFKEIGIDLCNMEQDRDSKDSDSTLSREYLVSIGNFLINETTEKIRKVRSMFASNQLERLAVASLNLEFEIICWKFLCGQSGNDIPQTKQVEENIKKLAQTLQSYSRYWKNFEKSRWSHFATVRRLPQIMRSQSQ